MNMLKKIGGFLVSLIGEWDDKEKTYDPSLGRVGFWIALGISIGFFWAKGEDIPSNLFWVLSSLLIYNVGKRLPDAWKEVKLNGNGSANTGKTNASPGQDGPGGNPT